MAADSMLARSDASRPLRLLPVVIAVLSVLPWATTILGSVFRSRSEDFIHHVMVFAAVVSLVGVIVIAILGVALERAGFIGEIPLIMVWPVMAGAWGVSVFLGQIRYR